MWELMKVKEQVRGGAARRAAVAAGARPGGGAVQLWSSACQLAPARAAAPTLRCTPTQLPTPRQILLTRSWAWS